MTIRPKLATAATALAVLVTAPSAHAASFNVSYHNGGVHRAQAYGKTAIGSHPLGYAVSATVNLWDPSNDAYCVRVWLRFHRNSTPGGLYSQDFQGSHCVTYGTRTYRPAYNLSWRPRLLEYRVARWNTNHVQWSQTKSVRL